MNERIKELAEQAALFAETEYAKQTIATFDTNKSTQELYEEKFAKLIIEECITIINKRKDAAIDADWLVDEAMTNAVWDIEEQLCGIKE